MKMLRACQKCNFLTEEKECPKCSGTTSKQWQGYLIIVDHTKSQIAKKMGIAENGKFAIKVR